MEHFVDKLSSPSSILLIFCHFLDVLEKKLIWPLGYPRPFRPSSRFEVIQWTLFDKNKMYAFTDQEPTSSFPTSYYGDFTEILQTVKQAINQKYGNRRLDLLNGYHRVDPKRGNKIR